MHDYLQQHPDIFMSPTKEPNFFGSDLEVGFRGRPSPEEYLSLFASARDEKRIGESSVIYLYSKNAAHEIKEFSDSAAIIIMLRNPVDLMHSLHAHFFQWNFENIADFGSAIEAESARKQRRRLPPNLIFPVELLWYREMARFTDKVQRYLDIFGRENVHIILLEDIENNAELVYRNTLEFLGVRTDFKPELRVIHANRQARSHLIKKIVLDTRMFHWVKTHQTSPFVVSIFDRLRKALVVVKDWNTVEAKRSAMDSGLRRALTKEFAPEVERLSELLRRDLSQWSRVT
jgi:hypothetical protein